MAARMSRPLVIFATLVLLAASLAGAGASSSQQSPVLLTLKDGADTNAFLKDHRAAKAAPIADGIVIVDAQAAARVARDPRVASAEADGVVRVAAATWNRAGWDTASWDRASWDASGWDASSWDIASWDRASWDRASWDRASWDRASWERASWEETADGASSPPSVWGQRAVRAQPASGAAEPLVCVIDSGIDATHEQLRSRLWHDEHGNVGIDLVNDDMEPEDDAGHGTHLAGIVAATPDGPMFGVSNARISSAKIFGAAGEGTTSHLIRALAWCASIESDVVLMALTEDTPSKALHRALRDAHRSGAVLIASAGNAGTCERCVSYPASDENVIAVASMNPGFERSGFSSSGPQVEIAMPGSMILSTYPGNAWRVGSGTSQAAAFAVGVIAMLIAEGAAPEEARRALIQDALDLERPGRDHDTGRGLARLPTQGDGA